MKKILLVLPFILFGCVKDGTVYLFPWAVPSDTSKQYVPSETIRNPECLNSDRVEVLQVYGDWLLLNRAICADNNCESKKYKIHEEELVAIKRKDFVGKNKEMEKYLYDGSTIGLGSWCFVHDGIYSYTSAMGAQKTIRKMKSVKSEIPNPAYKEWKLEQDKKQKEQSKS